jgi:hypothetical protein
MSCDHFGPRRSSGSIKQLPCHMVAMAVPDQLVGDLREFFRRLR